MRRFLVFGAVALAGLFWNSAPACAQFYQQRSQAAPAAPPTVNYFGLPGPASQKSQGVQISPWPAQAAPAPSSAVARPPSQCSRYGSTNNSSSGGEPYRCIPWRSRRR